jgi:regulatory protein
VSQAKEFDAAKKSGFNILSRRDHSTFELSRKLKERGFSEIICAQVIAYLQSLQLLDDLKFIRQWSRFRLDLHSFGPLRLRKELLEKGLPCGEVDSFINHLPEEWAPEILVETALLKRYKDLAILKTEKNRRRVHDFLVRKGHSRAAIFSVFRKLSHQQKSND